MQRGRTRIHRTLLTALMLAAAVPAAAQQSMPAPQGNISSLGFEQADVRAVMRVLAGYGDVNIVTDTQVTGQVNMQLRNVTWVDALEAVMSQMDLVSIPSLAVIETGLPEGVEFISVMTRNAYNTREQQRAQQQQDMATAVPMVTEIIKLNNSRAQEISTAVEPLRSEDGFIQTDTRTNSIILQDYPENLDLVKQVIARLDIPVRQIRIEAMLLEVDNDKMREQGLNWDLNVDIVGNPLVITQNTNLVTSPTVTGTMNFASGTLTLDGTIALLETQGVANIVATPSISVLDNTQGRVFMGEQIPLRQLDVAGNVTIQLQQVGTELTVTPHIVQNDEIILELSPKRESFRVDPSAGIIISTQDAQTTVTVRNGETAVIGGLKSQTETVGETGVPFLMDIPLLGNLFRYRTRQVQVRDLILFVTPRIEQNTRVNLP